MSDDPYTVLGIDRSASREEVAEAYRALAQIYHPDRYAEAPPRVQAEAHKRMQALNAAFEQARRAAPAGSSPPPAQPPRPQPAPQRPSRADAPEPSPFVHYVDGAKGYHNGTVAPLGFGLAGSEMTRIPGAKQCSKLDAELLAWFDLQRRNASLSAQQLYQSWTPEEQAGYAARLGCSQVVKEDARMLGVPCGECRP